MMRQDAGAPAISAIMKISIISLLIVALSAPSQADSTYFYQTDYAYPKPPDPIGINCSFFYQDIGDSRCRAAELANQSANDALILGLIKRQEPELNHDWVRLWNSKMPSSSYYENATYQDKRGENDGEYGQNGSIKNAWFRLLQIYPSVIDDKDGVAYVPGQIYLVTRNHHDFVVPNSGEEAWCRQKFIISGSESSFSKEVAGSKTKNIVLSLNDLLAPNKPDQLTLEYNIESDYQSEYYTLKNSTSCSGPQCTISSICALNYTNTTKDTLTLKKSFMIKRYDDTYRYENSIAVPKEGFARGELQVDLPQDFLYYRLTVRGDTYTVRKNELKLLRRGISYPVLEVHLTPSFSKGGTLSLGGIEESTKDSRYSAKIEYKTLVKASEFGSSDCTFEFATPFKTTIVKNACMPSRMITKPKLRIDEEKDGVAKISATVTDQLGNKVDGAQVEFSGGIQKQVAQTDQNGTAQITIKQAESTVTVVAKVIGSEDLAGSQDTVFVPGKGVGRPGEFNITQALVGLSPIFLILLIVIPLMTWMWRKRSSPWLLLPLLMLAVLASASFAQSAPNNNSNSDASAGSLQNVDIAATLAACQNYDFDNAVRHLGECSESYRIAAEFNSMRSTAAVLVQNIAPLIVANPDISPYRQAYSNMAKIALSLFRVAWAFNSLYLILNIFNPAKRHQALSQYIWLIIFVMFIYASFAVLQDSISVINSISTWVAGENASSTLAQATLSAEFVTENYEMLKLVLPFMNLSYLILLARYITVIGMILFFPFTLLMFFTSATRGFGKAALTVTFATLGLGVINAILLLIYNILVKTADPTINGSFASTFFSASFIVFFGFVNLLVILVAFLSGSVLIGQSQSGDGGKG